MPETVFHSEAARPTGHAARQHAACTFPRADKDDHRVVTFPAQILASAAPV
jgi:hypothetical protein